MRDKIIITLDRFLRSIPLTDEILKLLKDFRKNIISISGIPEKCILEHLPLADSKIINSHASK